MSSRESAAARLRDAVADFYRRGAADPASAAVLHMAADALDAARPAPLMPLSLPAAALLPAALDAIAEPTLQPLAAALAAAAPMFRWRQNPNYSAASMGAAFMAGYGYVEFAGPRDALFSATAVRVGLLLLGPGLHYPAHAHPAEEVYHPLTDGGAWRRGDEAWRRVAAGAAIHHPPMMVHETRTGTATLLALYCWAGDTATEARLACGVTADHRQ